MKRGTPEHPKTVALAVALAIPLPHAVGLLEMLWHFAHDYAPQGNVGKWSDPQIAAACRWEGDAGAFVAALRDAGWLDTSEPHRLVVHDWHDHAEKLTKNYLQYHGLPFLSLRKHSRRISDNVGQSRTSRARAPVGTGTGTGTGSESSVVPGTGGVPGEPFDDFWAAYPKKLAKADARRAWTKRALDACAEDIAVGLGRWAAYWHGRDQQYTPNAATWLNDERWKAMPPEPSTAPPWRSKTAGNEAAFEAFIQKGRR